MINLDESQLTEGGAAATDIDRAAEAAGLKPFLSRAGTAAVAVCAKIELEIAQLDPADAAAFLADLGLKESGLDRVIRASYDLLGYISFFTVGEDECRAWSIPRGTPAQLAAGEIHSDIARGFIRAEVVGYDRADRAAARWRRAATTARSASKARSTWSRTATSSTSVSPHDTPSNAAAYVSHRAGVQRSRLDWPAGHRAAAAADVARSAGRRRRVAR